MRPGLARAAVGRALLASLVAGCAVGTPDAQAPVARPAASGPSVPGAPQTGRATGGSGAPAAIGTGPQGASAAPALDPSGPDADRAAGPPDPPAVAASSADAAPAEVLAGLAAVYSDRLVGRRTANGERYDRTAMTAAHKTLPFGTVVRVTNPRNGRSVDVRINDRGPFHPERILDLSAAAAIALGLDPRSVARVGALVVSRPQVAR